MIETNSLEITCKIRVESGSDYEIQLKRDNRLIDSSTEPRLSSLDSFASNELKFTFTITDAKESDEVSYICVFDDVAESNAYEPKIHSKCRSISNFGVPILYSYCKILYEYCKCGQIILHCSIDITITLYCCLLQNWKGHPMALGCSMLKRALNWSVMLLEFNCLRQ